jgi:drug/metabolite transporter (DMT)-like permease
MTDNLRGIVAILISATAFVLNDTLMKLAAGAIPAGEALFLRGVGASVLLGVGCLVMRQLDWRPFTDPLFVARAIAAAVSAIFIILSLQRLPLPKVSAVIQMTPLAVMAGAALIYGEAIGWRRWLLALVGFAGVLLIIRPGTSIGGAASWLALAALVFTVTRDLLTRRIPRSTPAILVAWAASLVVTIGGAGMGLVETWTWPSPFVWLLVSICAGLIVVAYVAGIVAMRTGELSAVVPFRYAQIPMTLGLGYGIWGDVPDALAMTGILIVAATGLVAVWQEGRRVR